MNLTTCSPSTFRRQRLVRRASATLALLLAATTGCALPGLISGPVAASATTNPSADSMAAAPAAAAQRPAERTPATAPEVPAPQATGIAQVSHNQPTATTRRHVAASPAARPASAAPAAHRPVAPTSHQTPAAFGPSAAACGPSHGGHSACGCGGHGGAGSYFTSGPWNQYGIDPQEFLCDGGDRIPEARVRTDGSLLGIGLEDTVVKYKTEQGDQEVQPSNRVCIYAPRFGAVRQVSGAVVDEHAVAASGVNLPEGPIGIDRNQPSSAVTAQHSTERSTAARGPDAFRDRDRGVPVEGVTQPIMAEEYLAALVNLSLITQGELREADKPWLSKGALAAVGWSHDTEVAVAIGEVHPVSQQRVAAAEGLTVYDFPDAGRLRICKLADKQNALPGEIVTFLLRIDNVGDSAVNEIVITDSLTTRLEYVEGSQTCSVGAIFETNENEGRSLQLTWELTDELKVGEGANIRFQCRVR